MGGIIIIIATLIPVLLFSKLENIYIILLIITMLWMGLIGFADDYIKKFKSDKDGLKGYLKIIGQVILGVFVGSVLYFHPQVTIKDKPQNPNTIVNVVNSEINDLRLEEKSTRTTIPFFKNNEFDYSKLITWISPGMKKYAWLVFIPMVIFIVTAVSNGANLTDGIDGLAAGTSAIIVLTLGIVCLDFRECYFLRISKYNVHPKSRRNDNFYCCFCRFFNWIFMVQHLSSSSFYGRYR